MNISEKIKRIREDKKLSQEKFGKKIGVKTNTVWRWETGQTVPQTKTLQKICVAFDIPLSKIVDEDYDNVENVREKFTEKINKNSDNVHVTVGTETMTYEDKEGNKFTVPYDEKLSLQILNRMFTGEKIIINNGIQGNNNSNNNLGILAHDGAI